MLSLLADKNERAMKRIPARMPPVPNTWKTLLRLAAMSSAIKAMCPGCTALDNSRVTDVRPSRRLDRSLS
jgi:hypothetical protein